MDESESRLLQALDRAVQAGPVRPRLEQVADRVQARLSREPTAVMAWEPIPLSLYGCRFPTEIRSSWVFVLRARATTGAERHPNSRQRMLSFRGQGDFQTRPGESWVSHHLVSDPDLPWERRWISIPTNVWHQGVVPDEDWIVVSFQSATESDLIEEREAGDGVSRRHYVAEPPGPHEEGARP